MFLQAIQAIILLPASSSPITQFYPGPFRPLTRRQSYGAPSAPTSYDAPILPSTSSSSSYSQPTGVALAASLGTASSVPAIPVYERERGEDCLVERSTVNTGDCQQGGQECSNQCSSVPAQDCSGPAQPVCVTVTEEKCEIQYETVYEEVCEAGAPGAEQCQTVEEQVCTTVEEEQCSTVTENVCETEYSTLTTEECGTELETKCETEVRQAEMREAVRSVFVVCFSTW